MRVRRSIKYCLKCGFVLCSGSFILSYLITCMHVALSGRATDRLESTTHLNRPGVIPVELLTKKRTQRTVSTATSTGESLAQRIVTKCKGRSLRKTRFRFPVSSNTKHNLLFCPICKLGSTYWTRFFKFLEHCDDSSVPDVRSPYDIPIAHAPPSAERMAFVNGKEVSGYGGHYSYVFVRDPYSRVVSAYIDKLFAPNPVFWKGIASAITKRRKGRKSTSKAPCGSDLKFSEYIKAIIRSHKDVTRSIDCHDASFTSYCHPCEVKYNFVGKIESFVADSQFIYRKAGLNGTIAYLQENGGALADEDALLDTVYSPFEWKSQIKNCISWREALLRIWRKLQIRGVIGKDEFPLDERQSENISRDEFVRMIKETQNRTPYSQRKLQRLEAMVEIFSEVSKSDMEAFSQVYSDDFDLFEYESKPSYLFNISTDIQKFGYLNV